MIFRQNLNFQFFFNLEANWTITNLHPPPPTMPSFTQTTSASINSVLNKSGGGGAALTYEEDALILRVIESYSAAYQSTSRNTMHAGKKSLFFCCIDTHTRTFV